MIFSVKRSFSGIAALCLAGASLMLAGCGGSSGVSSQVVSGVASVGATLAGQVQLKDASGASKTAVIGNDGSYAIDVTGMKAPFIVQATGSANGVSYTMNSYADGTGTANVNPLSHVAVASAAGQDDPFTHSDAATLGKIGAGLPTAIQTLQSKLQKLLQLYHAEGEDPLKGHYVADHTGLDGMFDNVKITLVNGVITVTNTKTGAIIFTANIADLKNGTNDDNNLPSTPAAPTAPAGLTATGGANQVALAWSAVSNATSYNIYWSNQPGVTSQNGTKISAASNSSLHAGLNAATTYYYVVSAVNSSGESAVSAQVSATTSAAPVATVPTAPVGVSATGGSKQVTLAWGAVAGATSYNVYWSTSAGVTTANGNKLTGCSSPSVLNNLTDSTSYYYIVTALNAVGESAPSVQVAATTLAPVVVPTAPAAPTAVTALGGAKQVTISWSAATGASSYNLYWSTSAGVTPSTGTRVAAVSSPYVLTNLAAGTSYYFVVTAQNSVGESAPSAAASAATSPAPPALPAAPTATATGGSNQVSISWSAVSGASSYNLYWSTTAGVSTTTGTKIAGATSPYLQTGLAAGTSYYYVVTALNAAGEGPASAQATAATAAPVPVPPAAPAGVTATSGTNLLTVSWSAVSGATSYNLYYSTATGVSSANGTKVTGVTAPYTLSGLAAGTPYYLVVTAVGAAGEGAASAQATATTAAAPPAFDALSFYNNTCLGCHGTLGPRTAAQITSAIASVGSMSRFRSTGSSPLTAAQISAIAAVSY